MKKLLTKYRNFWWKEYTSQNLSNQAVKIISANLQDKILEERLADPVRLERYGAKTYSQNDEDGIIEEIFSRIGTTNKVFVEFGVGNGLENCTHYLLYKGFRGGWIEGNQSRVSAIKDIFSPVIKQDKLKIISAFINRDNINSLIKDGLGISGEIDLLSVDITGNDYYVWESINVINPRIVIMPYAPKFLPSCEWIMKYDEDYVWNGTDVQYASLKSIELLGRKKGYTLVGTNANGVNAFLIRDDLVGDKFIKPATAENLWNPARKWLRYESGFHSNYTEVPLISYSSNL